jgi:hypothetical protein
VHRPCLAAGTEARCQSRDEAPRKVCIGKTGEHSDHFRWHVAVCEKVTGGDAIRTFRRRIGAERLRAGPRRGDAIAIYRRELPPRNERLLGGDSGHGLVRGIPFSHAFEQHYAQSRIGDVLRAGGADACAGPRATRRDGG